jgi:crotonobetainyl-CoA:carnitine CoA-transferase CaiB-like acyl-CoA transferase
VLASLGLDAAMLRRRFPRLIIASISSQGETGPDRDLVSFGSTLEATGGMAALTGTGDDPVITGREMNYPDQVVCLFAAGAIIAALLERDRTGEGVHLDLSQRELTSFLLGEALLSAASGAPQDRLGNTDPADPQEAVVETDTGWEARWSGGSAPVLDGAGVVTSARFRAGGAMMTSRDGRLAKGVPFRFGEASLPVPGPCRPLGADNRAVLRKIGLDEELIGQLEDEGVLAQAPRERKGA